ncbi:hypothetical protein J6590_041324 [Homalodisca vitripennis]|nr:hypothetical protein J6590_041324 [Homalodisca vitripennis]
MYGSASKCPSTNRVVGIGMLRRGIYPSRTISHCLTPVELVSKRRLRWTWHVTSCPETNRAFINRQCDLDKRLLDDHRTKCCESNIEDLDIHDGSTGEAYFVVG